MYLKRTLVLLSLNILIIFSVMVAIFPLAPGVSKDLGMSAGEIGAVAGIASLIMTFLSIPSGVLADRYGRKRLITLSQLVSTIALLIISYADNKSMFIAGWIVFGISRGFLINPCFVLAADICSEKNRGMGMGMLSGSVGVGSILGYIVSGIAADFLNWRAVFKIFTILLAGSYMLSILLPETFQRGQRMNLRRAFVDSLKWLRNGNILLACIIGTLCFMVGIYATFIMPFAAKVNNIPLTFISILFILYEIVTSFGSVFLGWLSDKFGRKIPLIVAQIICIAAFIILYKFNFSSPLFAVAYAFIGLTEGPIITIVNAVITDIVMNINPKEVGAALGTTRTLGGIGIALGPTIAGSMFGIVGVQNSFLVGAIILAGIIMISMFLKVDCSGNAYKIVCKN
jgi:MFS family permease